MIDAHIHLQDKRFDADRDDLIRQAENKGVTAFFCASTHPQDARNVIGLAQKHARIIPFIGTHPWFSDEYDPQDFETLLKNYPHAGVGEIGLDGLRGRPNQESVFQDQLNTAARLNRPCVIHCVKLFDPVARIIKQAEKLPPALLFHGFSGTKQQADFFFTFQCFFFHFRDRYCLIEKQKYTVCFQPCQQTEFWLKRTRRICVRPTGFAQIRTINATSPKIWT